MTRPQLKVSSHYIDWRSQGSSLRALAFKAGYLFINYTTTAFITICNFIWLFFTDERISESSSVPKLSEADKDLSLAICKVLDEIGASEETRRLRIHTAITREILHTITTQFVKGGIFDFFVFGSLAEGTTIRGLNSDVDYVYCINEWNVIDAVGAASTDTPFSLLMVRDEATKPGYVKLQAALNGTPQTAEGAMGNCTEPFQLDQRDRVIFCRPPVQGIVCEEHGPAWSIDASLGFVAQDHVMALRCQVLPECIKSWFRKVRKHNWPPADLVEEMKSFGVFLVPVGHP